MLVDAGRMPDASAPPAPDGGSTSAGGGCTRAPGENDRTWTLRHGGVERSFLVHIPRDYDPSAQTPLVFDLHGRTFTAEAQRALTGMNDLADREGFIVVHPQGIGRTWNGGVCCGEAARDDIDDVGFIRAVLETVEAQLCVDPRRVFAAGMSNGGFLAHRLGCELSDRIAAIVPVAGVMGIADCAPPRAVPVLHFHGDADQVVRYDGYAGYLSAQSSSQGWAQRNGCASQSMQTWAQDDVRCQAWTGCQQGATVQLCTIAGGGHTWPGGAPLPPLGRTTQTISATELAWAFFQAHPMP